MKPTEHSPGQDGASPLSPVAEWAGYLCVAPFILCLAGVGLLPDYGQRDLAQRIALGWGAALLAFTGAVHWGLALGERLPWEPGRGVALLPAALGAVAVVLGGERGLALLVVGFGLFWLYEHRVLGQSLPKAYLDLRRQLTLATCILLALTMFASD
ncbi:MAG TPA: DUF3429 domain-containing protein, partial [Candidatus Dormibacteraeota bacterium]|nr:DUF3429 domain-containing protein [Candidatus Dormibacteraeota bacterium]